MAAIQPTPIMPISPPLQEPLSELESSRFNPSAPADPRSETDPPLRIGWGGSLLIAGFWTFFGAVMAASLLLSPLHVESAAPPAVIVFTFMGAYTWAALTPPVLRLAARIDLMRGGGVERALRLLVLLVSTLFLAILVSLSLSVLSSVLLQNWLEGSLAGRDGMWRLARYRFLNDLLACHLVVTAGLARHYFFSYRARQDEATALRAQLVQARLQVLRSQLNPHFLFNTLNGVAALVSSDPRGVRRMIACLSDLLRYTLDGAADPVVPVEQEIRMVKRYLEIAEIRFRDRLRTRIEIETGAQTALVPNLILQPLVENAVKHGVGHDSEASAIDVEVGRRGSHLVLTVTNTGPPPDAVVHFPDGPRSAAREHGGLGLRHTCERLHQLYGAEGRLTLDVNPSGRTLAEIRIPYQTTRTPSLEAPPVTSAATEAADSPVHV